MGKLVKAKGNMYNWVTHMWNPIIGCPHQCVYCYVKHFRFQPSDIKMDRPFPPLGKGKNIFVGHLTDIFSSLVPEEWINVIFHHCRQYDNKYIFQTKDPGNIFKFFSLPPNSMVGTTIETNRFDLTKAYSKAPDPALRAMALHYIPPPKFLTIEPILDFDVDEMLKLIETAEPSFINIGADSKGHGLIEPPADKIIRLIGFITMMGIEIREKSNLDRLIKVNNNA